MPPPRRDRTDYVRMHTDRGVHPDIDPQTGELRPDVGVPERQRDFNRRWATVEGRAEILARIADEQRRLPQHVQEAVSGVMYDGFGDPYTNYLEYLADTREVRGHRPGVVTGADIERMSLDEYDKLFDEYGRPRDDVIFQQHAGRDLRVDAGIDRFSAAELARRREP